MEEFHAGWERWLGGARLAQLKFVVEDAARVGVLPVERNGILVLAEEGDFTCTGPWHCDGWVIKFSWYYYFGWMVIWIPLMRGSLIPWGVLALTRFLRVMLPLMIRWADIDVGWMLVIGGSSVGHFCCLRFPLIRVWRRVSWGG